MEKSSSWLQTMRGRNFQETCIWLLINAVILDQSQILFGPQSYLKNEIRSSKGSSALVSSMHASPCSVCLLVQLGQDFLRFIFCFVGTQIQGHAHAKQVPYQWAIFPVRNFFWGWFGWLDSLLTVLPIQSHASLSRPSC
jgi:hypothetical protein